MQMHHFQVFLGMKRQETAILAMQMHIPANRSQKAIRPKKLTNPAKKSHESTKKKGKKKGPKWRKSVMLTACLQKFLHAGARENKNLR